MKTITIGTDPELFVFDLERDQYVSAHTMFPGTKESPHPVKYGAIQVDGVAAEFNTRPAKSAYEFMGNIVDVMDQMKTFLPPKHVLIPTPVAVFEQEYFDSLDPLVKMLGCEPDFNAYTGQENTPPETTEPFRTGAGHIHVGWGDYFDIDDPEHFDLCCEVVKELDKTLYPLSLTWDNDEKRRTLYGAKGSFRPKVYGVEYRPLSNAYLRSSKSILQTFNIAKLTVELFFEQRGK